MQAETAESTSVSIPIQQDAPIAIKDDLTCVPGILAALDAGRIDHYQALAYGAEIPAHGNCTFTLDKGRRAIDILIEAKSLGIPVPTASLARSIGIPTKTLDNWVKAADSHEWSPAVRIFAASVTRLRGEGQISTLKAALTDEKVQPRDRLQSLAMTDPAVFSEKRIHKGATVNVQVNTQAIMEGFTQRLRGVTDVTPQRAELTEGDD